MVRLGLVTYTAINMLRAKTLPTVLQSRRAYDFSVQEVILIRQKCSEYWFCRLFIIMTPHQVW